MPYETGDPMRNLESGAIATRWLRQRVRLVNAHAGLDGSPNNHVGGESLQIRSLGALACDVIQFT